MLTTEQEQELVRQFESGEWDPSEWELTSSHVFRVTVTDDQLPRITARAQERGETVDEYLSGIVGAILATA